MGNKNTYLYVILLPQMDENRELGYMIKFGYTENLENRMRRGYESYYRYVEVLHVYEGEFTMRDETKIKQHLKEYVLFGDEYLKYCSEVLDFFNTYDTTEKLKKKINSLPFKSKNNKGYYNVDFQLIELVISKSFSSLTKFEDIQNKRDKIFRILREYEEIEQLRYICTRFSVTEKDIENYIESRKVIEKNTPNNIKELVTEFNELGDSCKKLTMLVNLKTIDGITEHDINSFLELIQPKYKEYYVVMGPEFIKTHSCLEAEINREWKKKLSNETVDITSEILKIFKPGDRYSKSDIKSILGDLYEKLGYHKTAKATDLEALFTLKLVKVVEKDGKKSNGFELLEKKGGD